MPISRYPRPGHPIAPSLLAPLLDRKVPRTGLRFSELDASTWNKFSHKRCYALGILLKEYLQEQRYSLRQVGQKRLTSSRKCLTIHQLELTRRSFNCLSNVSLVGRRYGIGSLSVDEVLAIPFFGISSLLDTLTSIESFVAAGLNRHTPAPSSVTPLNRSSFRETDKAIASICATSGLSHIGQSDPRVGRLLRSIHSEIKTIGDLVKLRRSAFMISRRPELFELRDTVERCRKQTIETELLDLLLKSNATSRNKQLVARHYGCGRRTRETLEAIGNRYDLTRERVRQIVAPPHLMKRANSLFLPALDAALHVIHDAIPATCSSIETRLVRERLIAERTSLRCIQFAAEHFRPKASFELSGSGKHEWALATGDIPQLQRVPEIIRPLVRRMGAGRTQDVLQHDDLAPLNPRTRALVKLTIASMPDVHWLDSSQQWIWSEQAVHSGLRPKVMQVLSGCRDVSIDTLHTALLRIERSVVDCLPPKRMLLELCRHMKGIRVEGRRVIARHNTILSGYLNPREEIIVKLLKKHGPLCRYSDFRDEAFTMGIPITALKKYLRFSLAITSYAKGVYGVVGLKVMPHDLRPYLQLRRM
jgi:hypothetical protein